ncbi:hypothetical protein [Staphylococcus aureus]|uniref:hypothetical protein n=1 Tax=Staphylococcus aureus TaxID=1280 RepID=UPI001642F14D|nr:hypothetical protein [Staphylococcus aureus]
MIRMIWFFKDGGICSNCWLWIGLGKGNKIGGGGKMGTGKINGLPIGWNCGNNLLKI